MKVVIKKAGEDPAVSEIENNLKALQKFVGGYIEIIHLPKSKLVVIMDEEGKLKDREINLYFKVGRFIDYICGDFIISAQQHGNFRDLTDEEVKQAIEYCNKHSVL